MKTKLLFSTLFLIVFGVFGYGQSRNKSSLQEVQVSTSLKKRSYIKEPGSINKLGIFTDTIRYPQAKEQILGAGTFFTFDIWKADNEAISQTFLAPESGLQIKGIELYGKKSGSQTIGTSTTVRASVYNVDGSNNPTGNPLATGTVAVKNLNYYTVNFSSPISVTGNYAVVIFPENAEGILTLYISNTESGQVYDENLSRFKSSYVGYGNVSNWSPITSVTIAPGITYDFEPLVAPIVSYSLDTKATISKASACLGNEIEFTNTTSSSLLSNRMYNYNLFKFYFGITTTDETFAWDMNDDSERIFTGNTTYTYLTAGTYHPTLYTLGGFWTSCVDSKEYEVIINPAPTATLSVNGDILSVAESGEGVTYEWANCLTGSTVSGATSQTFIPTDNESYYAIVTVNGCSTTSLCGRVAVLTVDQNKVLSFDLYPNPADEQITVKGLNSKAVVSILDLNGRVLLNTNADSKAPVINIKNLKEGVYYIKITSDQINEVRKFIKK